MEYSWYKHYKGGMYNLIGSAIHTETEEDMTIYIDKNGKTWVRPSRSFYGRVYHNGSAMLRFTPITEETDREQMDLSVYAPDLLD